MTQISRYENRNLQGRIVLSHEERRARELARKYETVRKAKRKEKKEADIAAGVVQPPKPPKQGLEREELTFLGTRRCSAKFLEELQRLYPKHNEVVYAKPRHRRYYRSAPLAQLPV